MEEPVVVNLEAEHDRCARASCSLGRRGARRVGGGMGGAPPGGAGSCTALRLGARCRWGAPRPLAPPHPTRLARRQGGGPRGALALLPAGAAPRGGPRPGPERGGGGRRGGAPAARGAARAGRALLSPGRSLPCGSAGPGLSWTGPPSGGGGMARPAARPASSLHACTRARPPQPDCCCDTSCARTVNDGIAEPNRKQSNTLDKRDRGGQVRRGAFKAAPARRLSHAPPQPLRHRCRRPPPPAASAAAPSCTRLVAPGRARALRRGEGGQAGGGQGVSAGRQRWWGQRHSVGISRSRQQHWPPPQQAAALSAAANTRSRPAAQRRHRHAAAAGDATLGRTRGAPGVVAAHPHVRVVQVHPGEGRGLRWHNRWQAGHAGVTAEHRRSQAAGQAGRRVRVGQVPPR